MFLCFFEMVDGKASTHNWLCTGQSPVNTKYSYLKCRYTPGASDIDQNTIFSWIVSTDTEKEKGFAQSSTHT